MVRTANSKIATEPFPETHLKLAITQAFAVPEQQKGALQALRVVLPTEDDFYKPGDIIYVAAELCKHPFAANIVVLDGKSCIFLEKSMVVAWQKDS